MQKVLSLIPAVALMLSLSITAFASGQGGSKDVTAKYQKTTGGWDKTEAEIKVTNHSNVAVDVAMDVEPVAGNGVNVALTGGNGTLAAGVEGDVDGAASLTGKLTISGTPNSTVTATGVKVAEVKITVE